MQNLRLYLFLQHNDEGSRTAEFRYCYPDDYAPDVAFGSTKHITPRKDSHPPDVPGLGDFPAQAPSGSQLEAAHQTVQPVLPDQVDATSDISLPLEDQLDAGTRNFSASPSRPHLLGDGTHEIPKSSPATAMAATVGSRVDQDTNPHALKQYKLAKRRPRPRAPLSDTPPGKSLPRRSQAPAALDL